MTISEVQVWDEVRGARTLTREEFIAEFGEEEWEESFGFEWPAAADLPPMTDGERSLANRMQAEEGVNQAAARAGVASIFDLPSEDDDEAIPLDDLVPQGYDDEAADALHRARQGDEL